MVRQGRCGESPRRLGPVECARHDLADESPETKAGSLDGFRIGATVLSSRKAPLFEVDDRKRVPVQVGSAAFASDCGAQTEGAAAAMLQLAATVMAPMMRPAANAATEAPEQNWTDGTQALGKAHGANGLYQDRRERGAQISYVLR